MWLNLNSTLYGTGDGMVCVCLCGYRGVHLLGCVVCRTFLSPVHLKFNTCVAIA